MNEIKIRVDEEATNWLIKLDRGLSEEEADVFFEWLAADPFHEERFKIAKSNWQVLDNLATLKDETADAGDTTQRKRAIPQRLVWSSLVTFGLAACVLFGLFVFRSGDVQPVKPTSIELNYDENNRYRLDDGSLVKLSEASKARVLFSSDERRVVLELGQAFFDVAKDPARPFIVAAANVEVSAIGTAFNVKYAEDELQVVVTEGRVALVESVGTVFTSTAEEEPEPQSFLDANQSATIVIGEQGTKLSGIQDLEPNEVRKLLQWQHGLITFKSEPLMDTVNEFNQLNETQLIIVNPSIQGILISGTFRSDNLHGFVKALQVGFGIEAEFPNSSEILLK